jgi:hypothetical protein
VRPVCCNIGSSPIRVGWKSAAPNVHRAAVSLTAREVNLPLRLRGSGRRPVRYPQPQTGRRLLSAPRAYQHSRKGSNDEERAERHIDVRARSSDGAEHQQRDGRGEPAEQCSGEYGCPSGPAQGDAQQTAESEIPAAHLAWSEEVDRAVEREEHEHATSGSDERV